MELSYKLVIIAFLILITVFAGWFLHKTGKPYNSIVFNIHKFSTIGFVVFLSVLLYGYLKTSNLELIQIISLLGAAISTVTLLASGALLSLEKFYDSMLLIHRISTGSFIVFTSLFFYSIYF